MHEKNIKDSRAGGGLLLRGAPHLVDNDVAHIDVPLRQLLDQPADAHAGLLIRNPVEVEVMNDSQPVEVEAAMNNSKQNVFLEVQTIGQITCFLEIMQTLQFEA